MLNYATGSSNINGDTSKGQLVINDTENNVSEPTWYTYRAIRHNNYISHRVTDASGKEIYLSSGSVSSFTNPSTPGIRLMSSEQNSGKVYIKIDNMVLRDRTATHSTSEDFEQLTSGTSFVTPVFATNESNINNNYPYLRSGNIGSFSSFMTDNLDFVSVIDKESDGNRYLKVSSENGSNGFWLMPDQFEGGTAYSITLDFKIQGTPIVGDSDSYVGIQTSYSGCSTSGTTNVFKYNRSATVSGLEVANINNDKMRITNFDGDEWYTLKIVRNGQNVDTYVWKRSDEAGFASATHGYQGGANGTSGVPALRLMFSKADGAVICLDNISITTGDAHVKCVGAQLSTTANTAENYAIRFIATVDSLDYKSVNLVVKAHYTESNVQKTQTFTVTGCTAYTSLIGDIETGVESYTAADLGGKYLVALCIYDIPKTVGNITFDVTTSCDLSGLDSVSNVKVKQYTATTVSFATTVDNGSVTLAAAN